MKGKFIVIDGPDGCGKSTHSRRLTKYLRSQGYPVLALREPGGTAISEQVRRILLDRHHTEMTVVTELFLYMAARAQLVSEIIKPALESGKIVICERFLSSTIVYQGLAGGLGKQIVESLGKLATQGITPDLTIILDIRAPDGLRRKTPSGRDRMERKKMMFHQMVRDGFLRLAHANPRKYPLVTSYGDIKLTQQKIREIVRRRLHIL